MNTGEQDAAAPTANETLDGEQELAPTPSAEQDGQNAETEEPVSMLDVIAGNLEEQFGPVTDDPEHQETEGAEATDVSDPNAVQDTESEQANDDDPNAAKVDELNATAADDEDQDDNAPLPDEVTEAELAKYKPKAGRRVQHLLGQRFELRQQVEQFRPLQEQIQSLNLGDEDVQMALGLAGSLQRGDFQGFLEGVAPMVQAAQQYMGQALSPDLQAQVDKGFIAPELAAQLASNQAKAAWSQSQLQRQRQQHEAQMQHYQEQQAQMAQEQVRQVIGQTVTSWESQVRQQDPDFDSKAPMLKDAVLALVATQGQPQTAEEALQFAKDAYAKVNQYAVVNRPAPQATRAAPDAGIGSRSAAQESQTFAEAVRRGVLDANSV